MTRFEIPAAPRSPKMIRITLPAELCDEIDNLADVNDIAKATVIEHAVAFAFATRKPKRTRTRHTTD